MFSRKIVNLTVVFKIGRVVQGLLLGARRKRCFFSETVKSRISHPQEDEHGQPSYKHTHIHPPSPPFPPPRPCRLMYGRVHRPTQRLTSSNQTQTQKRRELELTPNLVHELMTDEKNCIPTCWVNLLSFGPVN